MTTEPDEADNPDTDYVVGYRHGKTDGQTFVCVRLEEKIARLHGLLSRWVEVGKHWAGGSPLMADTEEALASISPLTEEQLRRYQGKEAEPERPKSHLTAEMKDADGNVKWRVDREVDVIDNGTDGEIEVEFGKQDDPS
jgi:hypothetical protein